MKCNPRKLVEKSLERIDLSLVGFNDNGEMVISLSGQGIIPLLHFMEQNEDNLEEYKNLLIGDKVVGKASALLLIMLKPRYVYGKVMSKGAKNLLEENVVPNKYGTLVEQILNFDKSDICPFEKSVLSIKRPEEALLMLSETLKKVRTK